MQNNKNIQISQKVGGVFSRGYGVLCRGYGGFARPSIFSDSSKAQTMLGITLPSRTFSSSTLMDGEAVISSQQFDDWGEAELLAELAKLQARF